MHLSLVALQTALAPDFHVAEGWRVAGARHIARATARRSGVLAEILAVRCDADGMATASLAREVGILECVAYQLAAMPLLASGRAHGWLYAIVPELSTTLSDLVTREGALPAAEMVPPVIAIANLLHFCHSQGIAHGHVGTRQMFLHEGQVVLGGFAGATRVDVASPSGAACIARDVRALAAALAELVHGKRALRGEAGDGCLDDPGLAGCLQHALDADGGFTTAIAFAQALCAVRDAMLASGAEVTGRDATAAADAATAVPALSDGAERSLRVLHALLDRAEVLDVPPEPDDPLVQRCWARADAQVRADDARLVALRCRWQLLAALDPVGALSASQVAAGAAEVLPYRARALAVLGHAAQARSLAVRAWFDDVSMDLAALRSVTMALLLTRAFDLATLVTETEGMPAQADPVIAAAEQVARERGAAPRLSPVAQRRTLRAIATAMDRRIPWTAELQSDPRWDALRTDRRFTALVARARTTWTSEAGASV